MIKLFKLENLNIIISGIIRLNLHFKPGSVIESTKNISHEPEYLLAIDAGVKTGLALFCKPANLIWYRSHNMGSVSSLRKAADHLLHSIEGLAAIVIEGGGPVAEAWKKEAIQLGLEIVMTDAGVWRKEMLYPREYRDAGTSKQTAIRLAKQVIGKSDAPSRNFPTHDAAEAVLIGLWGCKKMGWIKELPVLRR